MSAETKEYKSLRVSAETHKTVKLKAVELGMLIDELIKKAVESYGKA